MIQKLSYRCTSGADYYCFIQRHDNSFPRSPSMVNAHQTAKRKHVRYTSVCGLCVVSCEFVDRSYCVGQTTDPRIHTNDTKAKAEQVSDNFALALCHINLSEHAGTHSCGR